MVTMSQKSSLLQVASSVSQALTPDRPRRLKRPHPAIAGDDIEGGFRSSSSP
jgi:hypothetical protein